MRMRQMWPQPNDHYSSNTLPPPLSLLFTIETLSSLISLFFPSSLDDPSPLSFCPPTNKQKRTQGNKQANNKEKKKNKRKRTPSPLKHTPAHAPPPQTIFSDVCRDRARRKSPFQAACPLPAAR